MPSLSPSVSLCPNRMENTAPLPMHRPNKTEVRKVISVNADPTAAKASAPKKRPTDQGIRYVIALLQ